MYGEYTTLGLGHRKFAASINPCFAWGLSQLQTSSDLNLWMVYSPYTPLSYGLYITYQPAFRYDIISYLAKKHPAKSFIVLNLCFIVFYNLYNLANTKGDSVFICIRQVFNRRTNLLVWCWRGCIHVLPSLSWVKVPIGTFQQLSPFSSSTT